MNKHGVRWGEEWGIKNTIPAQHNLKKSVGVTVPGSWGCMERPGKKKRITRVSDICITGNFLIRNVFFKLSN